MEKNVHAPTLFSQDEAPNFDVTEFVFFALGRYRYYILAFVGLGILAGIALGLKQPNTYGSEGEFLVRMGVRERRTPENSLEPGDPQEDTPGLFEMIHLLDTPVLYERLAEELGPERILKPYDPNFRDNENTPKLVRLQHDLQTRFFFKKPSETDPDAEESASSEPSEASEIEPELAEVNPDLPEGVDIDPSRLLTPTDAAAAIARARTKIEPKKLSRNTEQSSRVLVISYEAFSPELAQDVVRKLMDLIKVRHREVFAASYQGEFISGQIKKADKEVEEAREAYFSHIEECGFFDVDSQKRALIQDIDQTKAAIDNVTIQKQVAEDELARVEAELNDEEMTPSEIVSSTLQNPLIQPLYNYYFQVKREIRDIPYAQGSFQYKQELERLEAELDEVQSEIDASVASISLEGGTKDPLQQSIINRRFEDLVIRHKELRVSLGRFEIEMTERSELLEEKEQRLDDLIDCEPVHDELSRERDKTQRRSDNLSKSKDEAEVLDLMDQDDQMSNLIFVQEASYNPNKLGPSRKSSLILGILMGVGAGVAFAFLRQLLDNKLRFPKNIERTLGLRVLGVIPEQPSWRRLGRRIRKAG